MTISEREATNEQIQESCEAGGGSMTIIVVICILAAIISFCRVKYHRNRADNLEFDRDQLRDQVFELTYQLDDAQRELAHVRHLHSTLLAENTTLATDLMYTEQRRGYLESVHMQRKGEVAGVLITKFVVNPKRKMSVFKEVAP